MFTGRKSADTAAEWATGLLTCESRRGIGRYLDSVPQPPSAGFRTYLTDSEVASHVKAHAGPAEVKKLADLANMAEGKLRTFKPGEVATCTSCGVTGEHVATFGPRVARAGKAHEDDYEALCDASWEALRAAEGRGYLYRRLNRDRLKPDGHYLARQNACHSCRKEAAAVAAARKKASARKRK